MAQKHCFPSICNDAAAAYYSRQDPNSFCNNYNLLDASNFGVYFCDGVPDCGWDEANCQFFRYQTFTPWRADLLLDQLTGKQIAKFSRKRYCHSLGGSVADSCVLEFFLEDNSQICNDVPTQNDVLSSLSAVAVCETESQKSNDLRIYTSYERHDHVEYNGFQQSVYCGVAEIIDPIGGTTVFPPGDGNTGAVAAVFPIWAIILVVLAAVLLTGLLIWFIWYKCCRVTVDNTVKITGDRRKSYGTMEPTSNYGKNLGKK